MDIVTSIATGITVAATVAIAIFAIPTIIAYRKQVQIGQAQVKVSQEQLFNQFRPVLYPVGDLEKIIDRSAGKYHVIWENQNLEIDGLKNIGTGPAFNIYGVLFGPPYITTPPTPPRERYVVWNYPALSPGQEGDKITLQQFTNISSETTIGGYPLYVPNDADHIGIIARFTLTYYDYQAQYGWMCRGHFQNIEHDIRELDRKTPATQQAEQFWIAAGQRAQS